MSQNNIATNNIKDMNYTSSIIFATGNGIFQINIGEDLKDSKIIILLIRLMIQKNMKNYLISLKKKY